MFPNFLAFFICRVATLLPRDNGAIYVMPFPTGTCALCCPIDLDRDIEYLLYTRIIIEFMVVSPVSGHPVYPTKRCTYTCTTTRRIGGRYVQEARARTAKWLSFEYFISSKVVKDLAQLVVGRAVDGETWPGPLVTAAVAEPPTEPLAIARPPSIDSKLLFVAYLRRAEYNVILVNWVRLATLPWYHTAVENTRLIGPHVARLVSWLDAQKAVPLSKIHVVGFSLGAEIAGFMGKALAPRLVGRITGLDAAYPLYMNTGREGHLAAGDAAFVDIIHTDGGRFGFPNPIGHADFYPNGGKPPQPGCSLESQLLRGMRRLIREVISCGHYRAWMLYVESITNPLGFPASRCPKWRPDIQANCGWTPDGLMGFLSDPRTRGKFYLRTNDRSPYARNATGYNF